MKVCLLIDYKTNFILETIKCGRENEHQRINELSYIRCFTYIIPNPHQALWGRNFYLHFADEETDDIKQLVQSQIIITKWKD